MSGEHESESQRRRTEVVARMYKESPSSADAELFSRMREALMPFIKSHPVFRALSNFMGEEDVLQEVLLRFLERRALDRFEDRGPGSLRAYVKKFADRVLRDLLRSCIAKKRGGEAEVGEVDSGVREAAPGPSTVVRHADHMAWCRDALPEQQSEAWELHVENGLDFEEIAGRLKCTAAAVRGRVFRAIIRLVDLGLLKRPEDEVDDDEG